ncbi:hypothetical protein [Clostridium sardiniense]|uniref:hypothetical protein n=1 Tax=Clostridium sardiniense TaxID=29369 RepID=UPI00195CA875|nr:hypothetical protein [Clostridium sardiniense]MBM7836306.1 hypothetical protein [Clostridium sardiniense]
MKENIKHLLDKNLGETIRIAGSLGDKEEKLKRIHIEDNTLYINNNSINLNKYIDIKLLDRNLISFRNKEELIVLLLKNK